MKRILYVLVLIAATNASAATYGGGDWVLLKNGAVVLIDHLQAVFPGSESHNFVTSDGQILTDVSGSRKLSTYPGGYQFLVRTTQTTARNAAPVTVVTPVIATVVDPLNGNRVVALETIPADKRSSSIIPVDSLTRYDQPVSAKGLSAMISGVGRVEMTTPAAVLLESTAEQTGDFSTMTDVIDALKKTPGFEQTQFARTYLNGLRANLADYADNPGAVKLRNSLATKEMNSATVGLKVDESTLHRVIEESTVAR